MIIVTHPNQFDYRLKLGDFRWFVTNLNNWQN